MLGVIVSIHFWLKGKVRELVHLLSSLSLNETNKYPAWLVKT